MADAVDENRKPSKRTDGRRLRFFTGFSFVLSDCCAVRFRAKALKMKEIAVSASCVSSIRLAGRMAFGAFYMCRECVVRHTVAAIMLFCARCRISKFVYFMNQSEHSELNGLID